MIDSHCHIAGPEFVEDLDAVVARAREAGLVHALVILAADDDVELAQASAVAMAWPDVRFAIGVHPHAAGTFAADPAEAARRVAAALDRQPLARAVGEIGLDYHYDHAPRDAQHAVFREQIRLAVDRRLPIVVHTREAEDDTFRILAEESATQVPVIVHCFTGDREMARRVLAAGCWLSLAGIVTFPRALELQAVAAIVPDDRLLIETDSPFLAPAPHRGTRNEPARVVRVAETIGALRGTSGAEVGRVALENFRRLFNP